MVSAIQGAWPIADRTGVEREAYCRVCTHSGRVDKTAYGLVQASSLLPI